MKIGETKLIGENIAPDNAKNLAIYDGDTKICTVDISRMRLPENLGAKLYSFGLLSDIHMTATTDSYSPNGQKFDTALTFFETQGCSFVCISGDLTNYGFWKDVTIEYTTAQFGEYKNICDAHPNLAVYGCCGNHENYTKPITENLEDLEAYMGYGINYTIEQGNDLFIFAGQSTETIPMSRDTYNWLCDILGANKNKRCFVFIHPFVDAGDSGNPLGLHHQPIFNNPKVSTFGYDKATFINLLTNYPNTILFHGHSHMDFENQFVVKNAIYSTALGYKSVHIPATAYTRNVSTGEVVQNANGKQGYVCDVYANYIVLKGYDFSLNDFVPIAQYCINTTIKTT